MLRFSDFKIFNNLGSDRFSDLKFSNIFGSDRISDFGYQDLKKNQNGSVSGFPKFGNFSDRIGCRFLNISSILGSDRFSDFENS